MNTNKLRRTLTLSLVLAGVLTTWPRGAGLAIAPVGRFASAGMGNVRDNETQLVWNGRSMHIAPGDAAAYCAGQGPGWRLPTIKELLTLVDESRRAPAWDVATFGDGTDLITVWFLSSTPYAPNPALYTWTLLSDSGAAIPERLFTFGMMSVRCVRS